MNKPLPIVYGQRLTRVLWDTGWALSEMRRHPDLRNSLAYDTALIWRRRLGPEELKWMLNTSLHSASPDDLEFLGWVLDEPPPMGQP